RFRWEIGAGRNRIDTVRAGTELSRQHSPALDDSREDDDDGDDEKDVNEAAHGVGADESEDPEAEKNDCDELDHDGRERKARATRSRVKRPIADPSHHVARDRVSDLIRPLAKHADGTGWPVACVSERRTLRPSRSICDRSNTC